MAATNCQLQCEDWVRLNWLPNILGQPFYRERLPLRSGGVFDFDAVSGDKKVAISISTSGSLTSSGKRGAGKLFKLRSDMYFLLLAKVSRRIMVLTEADMYELCLREKQAGRVHPSIEFMHALLPDELCKQLATARKAASDEFSPRYDSDAEQVIKEEIRRITPSNEALLELAKTHAPPTSWWNEDVDPFQPEEGD